MKKLALILASLTFFAGCAREDTPDMTETETDIEYGTGAAAPGETGTEMDVNVTPVVPVEPAGEGTTPEAQDTTPQSSSQSLQSDTDIQIITTNELNAPTQSGQEAEQPQPDNQAQP